MTAKALPALPAPLGQFAELFAELGDGPAAAIAAGVHPQRASAYARQQLADPGVRAAIEAFTRIRLQASAPMAIGVLQELAAKCPEPAVRLGAAKSLLDRSGFSAQDLRNATDADKDLAEMTPDELRQVLAATENELANRAKEVPSVPITDASSAEVIDIEG